MGGGCSKDDVRDAPPQDAQAQTKQSDDKQRTDADATKPAESDAAAGAAKEDASSFEVGKDGLPSVAPITDAALEALAPPQSDDQQAAAAPEAEAEPEVPEPVFNLPRLPSARALPECPPPPTMEPVPQLEPETTTVEQR
jgi:hypothetical protein